MPGFLGNFTGTLDSKNRLQIPSKLRQSSDASLDTCYLTLGVGGCIFLFPKNEWQRVEAKFENFNFAHPDANFVLRTLMANTVEVTPDNQNRILIPQSLVDKVGIKKDVLILGMIRRIEIWGADTFGQYVDGFGKSYEEVAAQLLL
jgi:MraZ protein